MRSATMLRVSSRGVKKPNRVFLHYCQNVDRLQCETDGESGAVLSLASEYLGVPRHLGCACNAG